MTTKKNDKQDNEVYILGAENHKQEHKLSNKAKGGIILLACLVVIGVVAFFAFGKEKETTPDYYFEPEQTEGQSISVAIKDSSSVSPLTKKGYIAVANDTINDVPLSVYTPHNASMTLVTGLPNVNDSSIVFAAMAADIRKDNNEIVGDFVLAGKSLARGIAKKGFCAIVNNTVTIGVGDQTPLLQQAVDEKGYFFRQYPLVMNGELIENKPKNKSIRRAIAARNNEIIMIESQNAESFHDFSQALIDIGISDAIYLVGGNAYGWYYNQDNVRTQFGREELGLPGTISYIVWQTK